MGKFMEMICKINLPSRNLPIVACFSDQKGRVIQKKSQAVPAIFFVCNCSIAFMQTVRRAECMR